MNCLILSADQIIFTGRKGGEGGRGCYYLTMSGTSHHITSHHLGIMTEDTHTHTYQSVLHMYNYTVLSL